MTTRPEDDLPSLDFDYEDVTDDDSQMPEWAAWIVLTVCSGVIAVTIFTVILAVRAIS